LAINEERKVSVSAGNMGSVEEAMRWVLGKLDGEFQEATFISVSITTGYPDASDEDNGELGSPKWYVIVTGTIDVPSVVPVDPRDI
jgi:hypothetical protein